jgi:cation transport regulator ChaC
MQYLEWREKQYDIRQIVDIYGRNSPEPLVKGALVYIASEDKTKNVNYLGPAPEDVIAKQIATSRGPSGSNCEYLYKLADAMREVRGGQGG